MKNVIIASVVASIAAGSAMARGGMPLVQGTNPGTQATASSVVLEASADVIWEGTVTDLPDGCLFTKNENGKMRYTEDAQGGGVWEVYQKAVVDVKVRGRFTNLLVEADQRVKRVDGDKNDSTTDGHNMYDVTVDYAAGAMPTKISRSYYNYNDVENAGTEDMTGNVTFETGKFAVDWMTTGKSNTIELGGTATMNNPNALIDNGDYELRHTVTCLQ